MTPASVLCGAIILIAAVTMRILWLLPTSPGTRRDLDLFEVAWLHKGRSQVARVALTELILRGALTVDAKGRIWPANPAAWPESLASRYGILPENVTPGEKTDKVLRALKDVPGVRRIAEELRAGGVSLPERRMTWIYAVLGVFLLAGGYGIIVQHAPVIVVLAFVLGVIIAPKRPVTAHGRAALNRMRQALKDPAWPGDRTLLAVAFKGFSSLPYDLRKALMAGIPTGD